MDNYFTLHFNLVINTTRAGGLVNSDLLTSLESTAKALDLQVRTAKEAGVDRDDITKLKHSWSFLLRDLSAIANQL